MKRWMLVMTLAVVVAGIFKAGSARAYTNGRLMDDQIFDNVNSMSQAQIQSFLVSHNSVCLANYSDIDFNWNGSSWVYGPGNISASQIIYKAAQDWGLNPQVIIATLQKEESLVTGTSCDAWRYNSAMGYACPDGSSCNPKYAGFSKQVLWGAWQLKFNKERSEGNTAWDGDGSITYGGFMTQGNRARCDGCTVNFYSGYATIDGQSIYLETGTTASLYTYTPHLNQSFPSIFEGWFGSTLGECTGSNIAGVATGEAVIGQRLGGPESAALTLLNGTATGCIEAHAWTTISGQVWSYHAASNSPAYNPTDSRLIALDSNGDGRDEIALVNYRHTASGMIEIHIWSSNLHQWIAHIATNRPALDPATAEVVAADLNGDGRDELMLIQYTGTGSGMVEVHVWSANLQQWVAHIASNRPSLSHADAKVIVADTNGDGRAEFFLVQLQNTGSGMIELHGWDASLHNWVSHIASNRSAVNPADNDVIAVDSNGNRHALFTLVQLRGTGSGRIEFHQWSSNLQQWISHYATNQPSF